MHMELMGEVREMVSEMKVSNTKHQATEKRVDKHDAKLEEHGKAIHQLQTVQAVNNEFISIMRGLNKRCG